MYYSFICPTYYLFYISGWLYFHVLNTVQFVSVCKTILDVIFLFPDLFIFEALLHLLMEKRNKRKRKAIFYALSSHRFAHSKEKKDLLTLVVGWPCSLHLAVKFTGFLIIYVVGDIIYPLLRDILHSATLPSILFVEVLKEGLYS